MNEPMRRMAIHELRDDEDQETKPDCISGIRRLASSSAIAMSDLAQATLERLSHLPDTHAQKLCVELRKCKSEFESWTLCPPTEGGRASVLDRFTKFNAMALSRLLNER